MRTKMLTVFAPLVLAAFGNAEAPKALEPAITRSLNLIEKSTIEYREHRECFSCHHQALPLLTLTMAKRHGFAVDDKNLQVQLTHTSEHLERGREGYLKGQGQGGGVDTAGYALWALEAGAWKPDEITAAVTEFLLIRDKERDHWRCRSNRPPTEASNVTTTALALRALDSFGSEKNKELIEKKKNSVRAWLLKLKPKDTEERVFRLQALHYLSVKNEIVQEKAQELINLQRDDGGWAQKDGMSSDAYATGSALTTLHEAGALKASDAVYQRGVRYLLETQLPDGSWHVKSRSKPFQKYFESGFPHKKDQFISIMASSWATQALILAISTVVEKPAIRLFEWERGIALRSLKREGMTAWLWFYEWNLFEAMRAGPHTRGTHVLKRTVSDDGQSATISSDALTLTMKAMSDGAELSLKVTNTTKHDWPEIAAIIPCFNPGPQKERNPQLANTNTYYLSADGLKKLDKREIHFNKDQRKQIDKQAKDGKQVFSFKWPTAEPDAAGGLLLRESTDGKWVAGVAWERFLSAQGHNPWECMHLSVRVGPLKPGESRTIKGRIYLFEGDRKDCLKKYRKDFKTGSVGVGKSR